MPTPHDVKNVARVMLAALKIARPHVALSRAADQLAIVDAAIVAAGAAGITPKE